LRYELEIAPARTFGFEEEIEMLINGGLAKGGSLQNSVIVGKNGYSSPLRYPDEFVRHKLLDLMGDIYLLGKRINATIIVVKGGHNLHVELVKKIKEVIDD
jgi:UDP-3-O-[3-hydroxymyristoyl] N-acetylglucosamine deacetylase